MKQLLYIGIILTVFFYSCGDNNESIDSKYELYEVPNDTSLYVSYYINGTYYKYFQIKDNSAIFNEPIPYNNVKDLYCYGRNIAFDRLITDDDYFQVFHPAIRIKFWNTYLHNKTSQTDFIYYYNNTKLSTELKSNKEYNYVYPPEEPVLKDTIFMSGVSLDWYTEKTMKYFNYDTILIKQFHTEKSYFRISDIKAVNNGYFLAKGSFSVKAISLNDTIHFEDGQFSFITK